MPWNGTSSASRKHIPESLQSSHSEIEWRKVADIGDVLRHAYPIVDDGVIWEVVVRDLPPLKTAVEAMPHEVNPDRA